ncbi:MAG: LysM peptidoglycan-binding domain-containing protein [Gammaproteobacteria bacterium]|nr:LysM peptidoglycan-binding domain-containing protein [Gammaproteobacteria bacterium]
MQFASFAAATINTSLTTDTLDETGEVVAEKMFDGNLLLANGNVDWNEVGVQAAITGGQVAFAAATMGEAAALQTLGQGIGSSLGTLAGQSALPGLSNYLAEVKKSSPTNSSNTDASGPNATNDARGNGYTKNAEGQWIDESTGQSVSPEMSASLDQKTGSMVASNGNAGVGDALKTATGEGVSGSAATSGTDTASMADIANGGSGNYTIQKGDTLSELAQKFGTTTDALAAANNIDNPDLIYAGAELVVPGTATMQPTSQKSGGLNASDFLMQDVGDKPVFELVGGTKANSSGNTISNRDYEFVRDSMQRYHNSGQLNESDTKKMQEILSAYNYKLGKRGIDGDIGGFNSYTQSAARKFMATEERGMEWDKHFEKGAKETGLTAGLLKATSRKESGFHASIKSEAGARGPMQFMADTAREEGLLVDPKRNVDERTHPDKAIPSGANYLRKQIENFAKQGYSSDDATRLGLAGYNRGSPGIERDIERFKLDYDIPVERNLMPTETKDFLRFYVNGQTSDYVDTIYGIDEKSGWAFRY